MRISNNFNIGFIIFSSVSFFVSCSSTLTKNESDYHDYYLNLKYEKEAIKEPTLGIIIPDQGLDTLSTIGLEDTDLNLINFRRAFIEYFPMGIKRFSSIKETNWIYYKSNEFEDYTDFTFKTIEGKEIHISFPYPIRRFQKKSNADFIMYIKNITVYQKPVDQKFKNGTLTNKYISEIIMIYAIWDNRNLELITNNEVHTISEFDRLPENWPFNNAVLKMSMEIFSKLPMFVK